MHAPEPRLKPAPPTLARRLWSAGSVIAATGLLGFGAVAWWPVWPINLPLYGLIDGLILAVLGTSVVIVPGLLGLTAIIGGRGGRHSTTWFVVAVALVLSALYAAYFWGSLMMYFREPENTFLW